MHVIRLRGFWDSTAADDNRTVHRRRFGRPTNLDVDEQVWLVGEPRPADSLHLNDEVVGSLEQFEFNITSFLQPRNELKLLSTSNIPPDELRLEIRRSTG